MKNPIKILHLEDVAADTDMISRELQRQDINFERLVVNSKAKFTEALYNFSPDIVLADHFLPSFTSVDALQIIQRLDLQIPFILVSSSITDALAVKIIKLGADDYIMKDRLHRLPTAVLNTIEKYRLERERKRLYRQVKEKQQKAEEAIRISNKRYELVAKVSSDMVWDWDLITGEIYRSKDGWEKMFCATAYKDIGTQEDWDSRIHPEDIEKVKATKQHIFNSTDQHLFKIECRILTDEGTYAYIEDQGYIMRNDNGKAIRLIGASKNITERKKAEDELKKLSFVAHQTSNAVIITDTEQKVQWVNEAFVKITEYQLEEIKGKRPGDFLQGAETNKAVVRYMRMKLKKKQAFECDVINYAKSGRKFWLRIQCQPEFDSNGKHVGFFALQTDITKEKQAEDALKSSEERYRYLFENNAASMVIWDMETFEILEANDTAAKNYGYTKEEFKKLSVFDLRRIEEYDNLQFFIKHVKEDPCLKTERIWKHVSKSGEDIYMNIASHKIIYNGTTVMMSLGNNVTDKMLLQKKLNQELSDKQNEITSAVITAQEKEREQIGGELHDNVNQILASALLYMGVAKRHMENPAILTETEKLINNAIKEIRILSHSLIPPSLEETSLQHALTNIIKIVGKTSAFDIHDKLDCSYEKNMPDKLKLSIYRIVQEQFNNIHKYAKAKNVFLSLCCDEKQTILYIKDDGIGFDTTKKYEGVGLMNIKTRASLYNGKVTINSSPGNGCELCIVFEKEVLYQYTTQG